MDKDTQRRLHDLLRPSPFGLEVSNELPPDTLHNLCYLYGPLQHALGLFGGLQLVLGCCGPALADRLGLPPDSLHREGRAMRFFVPGVGGETVAQQMMQAKVTFDTLAVWGRYLTLTVPAQGQPWRREVSGLLGARR
jgi:hypothetical protein